MLTSRPTHAWKTFVFESNSSSSGCGASYYTQSVHHSCVWDVRSYQTLATGLTVSREVHSGNTAHINDCISGSFITADMFEVSAHACFHNKARISVHSNQSAAAQICCSNPNTLTVFTNLLHLNDTKTLCKGINYYTGKRLFHFVALMSDDLQMLTE